MLGRSIGGRRGRRLFRVRAIGGGREGAAGLALPADEPVGVAADEVEGRPSGRGPGPGRPARAPATPAGRARAGWPHPTDPGRRGHPLAARRARAPSRNVAGSRRQGRRHRTRVGRATGPRRPDDGRGGAARVGLGQRLGPAATRGQIDDRGMPAKIASIDRSARAMRPVGEPARLARAAERPRRLGGDDERDGSSRGRPAR